MDHSCPCSSSSAAMDKKDSPVTLQPRRPPRKCTLSPSCLDASGKIRWVQALRALEQEKCFGRRSGVEDILLGYRLKDIVSAADATRSRNQWQQQQQQIRLPRALSLTSSDLIEPREFIIVQRLPSHCWYQTDQAAATATATAGQACRSDDSELVGLRLLQEFLDAFETTRMAADTGPLSEPMSVPLPSSTSLPISVPEPKRTAVSVSAELKKVVPQKPLVLGPPPPGYVCFTCFQPGHFRNQCPVARQHFQQLRREYYEKNVAYSSSYSPVYDSSFGDFGTVVDTDMSVQVQQQQIEWSMQPMTD